MNARYYRYLLLAPLTFVYLQACWKQPEDAIYFFLIVCAQTMLLAGWNHVTYITYHSDEYRQCEGWKHLHSIR